MLNVLDMVSCGGFTFDAILPGITSTVVTAIKIFVPLLLIFYGMLDLAKAVMANDEKVMKEAQSKLIKRFIYAIAVFLVVSLVQLVFGMLGSAGGENTSAVKNDDITACISCFVTGQCSGSN